LAHSYASVDEFLGWWFMLTPPRFESSKSPFRKFDDAKGVYGQVTDEF
jgi:hypothetical protein